MRRRRRSERRPHTRAWCAAALALAICTISPASAVQARSDANWRAVLIEGHGSWWEVDGSVCSLYQYARVRGSKRYDGRLVKNTYYVNPFTNQCYLGNGGIQNTTAVWAVRHRVLKNYFVLTGYLREYDQRLISYSSAHDRLLIARGSRRLYWWGCESIYNPFDCP